MRNATRFETIVVRFGNGVGSDVVTEFVRAPQAKKTHARSQRKQASLAKDTEDATNKLDTHAQGSTLQHRG